MSKRRARGAQDAGGQPAERRRRPTRPLRKETTDVAHADALINRLASARREGNIDAEAAKALLRPASARHRAALDRLAEWSGA